MVSAGRFDADAHEDLLVYNPATGERIVGRRQAAGGYVYTTGSVGVQQLLLTAPVESRRFVEERAEAPDEETELLEGAVGETF